MARRQLPKKNFENMAFDALEIIGEEPTAHRQPVANDDASPSASIGRARAATAETRDSPHASVSNRRSPESGKRAGATASGRPDSHVRAPTETARKGPTWEQTSLKMDGALLNRFKNAIYDRRLTLYEAVNQAIADKVEAWERENRGPYTQRPDDFERLPPGRRMR